MPRENPSFQSIIVSASDHRRLQALLASTLTQAVADKPYLKDLHGELESAQVVEPESIPPDVVTMNSTVRLRELESGEVETYTLVYPIEANIADGKLSILAPIGTAILGQRVGDVVTWRVPHGSARIAIEEIVFQPERENELA